MTVLKTPTVKLDQETIDWLLEQLVPVWQESRSTCQLWQGTILVLKNINLPLIQRFGNQLILIRQMLTGNNLEELKSLFDKLRSHIMTFCEKQNIPINVNWRQKSFLSMIGKYILYLKKGKDMSSLNDVFGCRFVVGDESTDEKTGVEYCFLVMNEIISFCIYELNATLILAESLNGPIMSKCEARKKFYIPKKSFIRKDLRKYVKNYLAFPKANGYRSLHIAVRFPSGLVIEFQIRSHSMHKFAESDSKANHNAYKEKRYGMPLVPTGLRLEGLNIPGFDYVAEIDEAGILHSKEDFGI